MDTKERTRSIGYWRWSMAVAALSLVAATAEAQVQGVVFRYDSAPFVDPAIYVGIDRPVCGDAAGKAVAFHAKARVLGTGATEGIFTADPVAADGLEAERYQEAMPAAAFRKFERPTINAAGDVTWKARLVNGPKEYSAADRARYRSRAMRATARDGDVPAFRSSRDHRRRPDRISCKDLRRPYRRADRSSRRDLALLRR
jgi:hypothetical protein